MSWFAARLLFESAHVPPVADPMFEDRIILLEARDEREAMDCALSLGRASERAERYEGATGDKINWELRSVLDVKPLTSDVVGNGAEVYYTFLRPQEAYELERLFPDRLAAQRA